MQIGIDFDGVIADSTKLKIFLSKMIYGVSLSPEDCTLEASKKAGLLGDQYKSIVKLIYSTPLTLDLDEVPFARESISFLQKNHSVHIITSRDLESSKYARMFLSKREIPYDSFSNTSSGSKLPLCLKNGIGLFVDNTYENLSKMFSLDTQLYLFSTPANRKDLIDSSRVERVSGWKDLLSKLQ